MRNNQLLAVMFADIADSTQLYGAIGNHRAQEATSHCMRQLSQVVIEYHGRILKSDDHEIMCTFQTADDAAKAAINMQTSVSVLAGSLGLKLHVRIGFHFGEVILADGDIFGDAVKLAVRMAAQAEAEQIITTGETVAAMSPVLCANSRVLTTSTIKGKSEPVQICALTWKEA